MAQASMRPGQTAPECQIPTDQGFPRWSASMRPGQTAPECLLHRNFICYRRLGFNEAGADCPGMPVHVVLHRQNRSPASMRPGQTAPECLSKGRLIRHSNAASMRPGQTAPECGVAMVAVQPCGVGFNEAGADCPGMLRELP